MSEVGQAERAALIRLLRALSPRRLPVVPPALPPELQRLLRRPPPRPPRAVLFDVYGTLITSEAGPEPLSLSPVAGRRGAKALGRLAKELSGAGYSGSAAAFARETAAAIAAARSELLAGEPHPEVDIERVLAGLLPGAGPEILRIIAVLLEACGNPCAPMPGARAILGRLADAGLALGLVSNAQFYTPLILEAILGSRLPSLGIRPGLCAFSFEIGAAKPSPAPFILVAAGLRELGLEPSEALMIGNSAENDVAPARSLGYMTGLFAGDQRSFRPARQGEDRGMPDIVVGGLAELARVLGLP